MSEGIVGQYACRYVRLLFTEEPLLKVPLIHVTSPSHPLADFHRPIPSSELRKHIQLVLTDRSTMSKGQNLGVLSARTWRLADLGSKHAFCERASAGGYAADLVESDLSQGTLVKIVAEDIPNGFVVAMNAVYRTAAPPGIAGRWFIDHLKQGIASAPSRPARRRAS